MLPEGWKHATIESLGAKGKPAVKAGPFGSSLKKEYYKPFGYKIYGQEQVISNDENYGDYFIDENKYNELKSCSVSPGDILISLVGTIGQTLLLSNSCQQGIINPRLLRISLNKDRIIPAYIQYILASNFTQNILKRWAQGGTMGVLNAEMIKTFPILLPPLPEQKKIAAILSTWDRAIEGAEKLLANSQQQKKALMQQLLTGKKRLPGFTGDWKKKTLSNVCQIKTGKKDVNEGCENGGYPFFTCAKQHTFSENYSYDCEAILIAGNGEVGKTHYYNGKFEAYQRTYILSDFTNISVFFLLHFIEFFLPLDISKEKQHGAMPYIKLGTLKDFSVLTPPLPEQQAIAAVLSTADEEITAIESDLTRLRQEKKALMQQLLTGKRRVAVD